MHRSIVVMLLVAGPCCSARFAARADAQQTFPPELVRFEALDGNPVFRGRGSGHWDVRIRERGWILRDEDGYHLWFTGYDGSSDGLRRLGYATSADGLSWTRHSGNPLDPARWIEDMMVVRKENRYYMFAEGFADRAQLLTSEDRVRWTHMGELDMRKTNGQPIDEGPFGTPTAWFERDTWYLFYERQDRGVWLATSDDLEVWTNFRDEPVLAPGPQAYDADLVALNQIVKHQGRYYAYYHGSSRRRPGLWTTNVAVSEDLVHWTKYPGNPLFQVEENKSSGILVADGGRFRLYTMHPQVQVHVSRP